MALFFRVDDIKHGKFYFPDKSEIKGFPYETPGIRPRSAAFEQKSRFRQPKPSVDEVKPQTGHLDKKGHERSQLPFYLKEYVNLPNVTKERMAYEDQLCISVLSPEEDPPTAKSKAKKRRKILEELEKEQFKSPRTFLSQDIYCRTPRSFHLDFQTRSPRYLQKEHYTLPKVLPLKVEYRDTPTEHVDEPIKNKSGRSMHFLRNTVVASKDKDQLLVYSAPLAGAGHSAPAAGDLNKYGHPLAYASAVRATAPNLPKSKYVKPSSKSYACLDEYLKTDAINEQPKQRGNPLTQRLYEAETLEDSEVRGYVISSDPEVPAKVVWTAKSRDYRF